MKKRKHLRDGLARVWQRIHKADLAGTRYEKYANPSRIDPSHPKAPKSHPLPKAKRPKPQTSLENRIVNLCHASLKAAGRMTYTEDWKLRQLLFHRVQGAFVGSSADCSQYVASILHWLDVANVSATDYTGSLLQKGKPLVQPKPGCVAIWGPGTGAHAAFVTEKVGKDWMTVGFGHQGAPDRNTLSGMNAYFDSVHQPGVRFLGFT